MDFVQGQFKKYRVTSKIHLGAIQTDLPEGVIVEFDGYVLKWDGKDQHLSSLQGGVKLGWMVPAEDTLSRYIPKPAGVKVRPATSAGKERGEEMTLEPASEEEQVVGNVDDNKARRDAARDADIASYAPPRRPQGRPLPQAPRAKVSAPDPLPIEVDYTDASDAEPSGHPRMQVIRDDGSDQEAVAVASLTGGFKPAKMAATRVSADGLDASAAELRKLDPVTGVPVRAKKLASSTVIRQGDAEDIRATLPGGATGDVAAARSGDDLADLLPDAATSARPRAGVVGEDKAGDARLQWDLNVHWRERVRKAIADYGNDKNAMRQIMEIENPQVNRHLRSELARRSASKA